MFWFASHVQKIRSDQGGSDLATIGSFFGVECSVDEPSAPPKCKVGPGPLEEHQHSRSGGRSRGGNCSCVARAGCVSPKLAGLVGTNLLRPSSSGDRLKWRANSETCCTYVAWVCGERLLTCISSVIRRRRDVMNSPLRRPSFAANSFPTAKPSGDA